MAKSQRSLGVSRPFIKNYKWLGKDKINLEIYNFFLSAKKRATSPTYFQTYWTNMFDTPLPWLNYFKNMYRSSCSTHLWAFQLKIFYKILPTRRMLKIWKLSEDNLCRFCKEEEEDIMHLFW